MKFGTTLVMALAPIAMARRVRNTYPVGRDMAGIRRSEHKAPVVEEPVVEHPVVEEPVHPPPVVEHPVVEKPVHPPPVVEHPPPAEHPVVEAPVVEHPVKEVNKEHKIVIIWENQGGAAETKTVHEQVTVTKTLTVEKGHATVVEGHTTTMEEGVHTVPVEPAKHTVTVGGPSGLVFEPEELAVPMGDTIIFEFLAANHTVTQSGFTDPCVAIDGGMDTGFMANPDNSVVPPPQVAMQVMSEDPLWFYCAQGNHCGAGMVFSVNPTAEKTHAQFKGLAIEKNGEGADAPITGGDPAELPPAEEAPVEQPPAEGGAGVTPGQGVIQDGNCLCVVSCAVDAFPSSQQGVGAAGGMAGRVPRMVAIS